MLSRYVISESLELRRAIKDSHELGRTIITDTTTVIQHTNCHQFGSTHCTGSVAHNLRMAVGQLWAFSATDVQVRGPYLIQQQFSARETIAVSQELRPSTTSRLCAPGRQAPASGNSAYKTESSQSSLCCSCKSHGTVRALDCCVQCSSYALGIACDKQLATCHAIDGPPQAHVPGACNELCETLCPHA